MTDIVDTRTPEAGGAVADRRFFGDSIHSSVSFSLAAMGVSVFRAGFAGVRAELQIHGSQAMLRAAVDVSSLNVSTPPEFRAHLLGDDFFAAERYPEATFESDPLDIADGETPISGRLTIRGVTHPVTGTAQWSPELTDPSGKRRRHVTLKGVIDRRAFDMSWNTELPSGESHLGNEVDIEAELGFVTAA